MLNVPLKVQGTEKYLMDYLIFERMLGPFKISKVLSIENENVNNVQMYSIAEDTLLHFVRWYVMSKDDKLF